MSQPGPKNVKRHAPYDPVLAAKLSAEYLADVKAGKFDNDVDDFDGLPRRSTGKTPSPSSSPSAPTEYLPGTAPRRPS